MIKNILFDLDGTIVNSKEGIFNGFNYALDYMNLKFNGNMKNFIGPPLHETFMNVFNLNEEETKLAVQKYREFYKSKGIYQNKIYNGFKELVIDLRNANKKVIVATSKPLVFTEKILEMHDIKKYFNFISGATLDGSREKKADIIKHAIEQKNLNNEECIMVGDRDTHIIGAKENNIQSIGVLYGFGTLKELQNAGADYIAKDMGELRKILFEIME